ncbi:PH domain-containing protein [Streptomyces globosus]|uniref:PH domain-containing protein n=1 Tax=Streptomyces globosus TaxID=68209 RepID=UPI0036324E05
MTDGPGPRSGPSGPAAPAPGDAAVPGVPPAGGEGAEQRLHVLTPLRRAWVPIAATFGIAAQQGDRVAEWAGGLSPAARAAVPAAIVAFFAAYGFLSWWFTRYAVTATELRIRSGLLFRRTAHIRLDRIQAVDVTRPLLARVAGVAKLRLDVIGTEAKDELAFLDERTASALRAELLARAAGFAPEQAAGVGEAPQRELLRVRPRDLAVALALTLSAWAAVPAAAAAAFAVSRYADGPWAFAALLPVLAAAWAGSFGRFLDEYDWRVAESPDGLRLDHGMLDRAHETVPPGRVQSVRIVEPLLWRRRGWVRVELSVAGSKNGVLVPVATRAAARELIARILPGADPEALKFAPAPRGAARWVVPVWWKGYALAVSPEVFAARRGRLCRRTDIVPHAKVQSIRLTQGPWERARGVADVHVDHGASGTVTARLRAADEAAELLAAQADRSRTSRAGARPDRWMAAG